ncbi:MAG: patatin-like phospholipase family protein [Elusimicrobia bacterium]|nr:patatin-like phospholipase family protein [Elusimicrobiota bacterium]
MIKRLSRRFLLLGLAAAMGLPPVPAEAAKRAKKSSKKAAFSSTLLNNAPPKAHALDGVVDEQEVLLTEALWSRLRELPPQKRPRVGLVLGGGGARGLAHIGVLKVLEQEKVPIDLVVGTSVGALVGALYTAGLPTSDIERIGQEIGWDSLTDLSTARLVKLLVTESLLSTERMEEYVGRYIGDKQFADLKTSFACVAADLKTGEQIIIREGSVALAARASATMPGMFQPVHYRHRLLVDGGVVNNVPVDVAKVLGVDIILCVNLPANFSKYNVSNVFMTLTQALYIQGQMISQERLSQADVVITPKVGDVTALELWKSQECIEAGIVAARESIPQIRKTLVKKFFERWVADADGKKAGK